MRLKDADSLCENIVREKNLIATDNMHDIGMNNGLALAHAMVLIAPTVDAVEVVRCKDCRHRDDITKQCAHPKAMGWDALEPEDDDFCSYGERKVND